MRHLKIFSLAYFLVALASTTMVAADEGSASYRDKDQVSAEFTLAGYGNTPVVRSEFASYLSEMEELKAEVAEMQRSLHSETAGDCEIDSFASYCEPIWYSGAEATVLQPSSNIGFDLSQNVGVRAWLGREWANGLGVRVAGFYFEDKSFFSLGIVEIFSRIKVYTFDAELTKRGTFFGADLLISGGFRVGAYNEQLLFPLVSQMNLRDFNGAGLTFSIGLDQPLYDFLNVYGNFRGSYLFGDTRSANGLSPISVLENQTLSIVELQIGLQYRRQFRNSDVFVRAGFETQQWQSQGFSDVGLFGPTFSIGFVR